MNSRNQFNVLVVCTGNVCRSPVAEAMLIKLLRDRPQIAVKSAGLGAPVGAEPHPFAVRCAKNAGFDVDADKRAMALSQSMAASSDLALVMEKAQLQLLLRRYPTLGGKAFLLGHWGEGEIRDPIGHPMEVFAEINGFLLSACSHWAGKLETVNLKAVRS